jgi:hypothetical protein
MLPSFYHDFMEYHKDRFDDFSVLIYENRKLVAVLPLIKLRMKFSLSRRTYGGLVYSSKINGEKNRELLKLSFIFFH